jgi:hypothetical protein
MCFLSQLPGLLRVLVRFVSIWTGCHTGFVAEEFMALFERLGLKRQKQIEGDVGGWNFFCSAWVM